MKCLLANSIDYLLYVHWFKILLTVCSPFLYLGKAMFTRSVPSCSFAHSRSLFSLKCRMEICNLEINYAWYWEWMLENDIDAIYFWNYDSYDHSLHLLLQSLFFTCPSYTFMVVFQQLPAGHSMVGESQAFCSKVVLYWMKGLKWWGAMCSSHLLNIL